MGMSSNLGAPDTGNLGPSSDSFLHVVPISQLNALLFGLLEPLVTALKNNTASLDAMQKQVNANMTNQQALDAQDAILTADVATLMATTQNVVTGLATLNTSVTTLTTELAAAQAANPALDLSAVATAAKNVEAANAALAAAVTPVTAPPATGTPNPPTTA